MYSVKMMGFPGMYFGRKAIIDLIRMSAVPPGLLD
jgi:hypothetical protein